MTPIPANSIRGFFRTGIQVVVSAIITWGPVWALLDAIGINVDPAQVALVVLPAVMSIYWQVGNWLQHQPWVLNNPVLNWGVGILMGGRVTPAYTETPGQLDAAA